MTSEEIVRDLAGLDGSGIEIFVSEEQSAALRDVLARLAAAEEDSRRLEWIEANRHRLECEVEKVRVWERGHKGKSVRDAIDAARKEAAK
jgi:hypothetical protein